jgi:hypothetical protein
MSNKKKYTIEIDVDTDKAVQGVEEVTTAVQGTNTAAGGLSEGLDSLTGGAISGFSNMLGSVRSAVRGMGALKAAVAATGVGLLIVALGSLSSWMSNTESGARTLATASTVLDLIWKDITDTVNDFATAIFGVGEETFGFIDIIAGASAALASIFLPGGAQITAYFAVAEAVAEEMTNTMFALTEETKRYTVENANLNGVIERQQKIIDDGTKSYSERVEALTLQAEASKTLAENTANLAKLEETTLQNQIALTLDLAEKKELQQELAEVTATRIEAETSLAIIDLDNAQKRREIDDAEVARVQSNIDVIAQLRIDATRDDRERIEAEFALAQETILRELELQKATGTQKAEATFLIREQELIALEEYDNALQAQKDAKDEADTLKQEQKDAADLSAKEALLKEEMRIANEKIAIEQAVSDAKQSIELQNIQNAAGAVGVLASLFEKNKALQGAALIAESAAGIASIVINTQAANAAALAKFALLPGGVALAAGQIAANKVSAGIGIAANIASTAKALSQLGGGSTPTPPGLGGTGGGGGGLDGTLNIQGQDVSAPDFINNQDEGANQNAIRAYVVEQNVTNSQQANQLIQDQASL